jgi:DNA-directed RNA polymerase specialized sigma24 family protein
MERKIIDEYVDACELVKETEKDIEKLKKRKAATVATTVRGSMTDFPYAETHFKIEGTPYTYLDDMTLRVETELLRERKENAERIKIQVEEWINTIPMRMQRIVRYRYMEGLQWEEIADRMGRGATGDSVRKELERYLKE